MNATTTHALPRLLVARRAGMKGNLSVTKPFYGSNSRCFNGQRFAIALRLQKIADFLHLLGSISVEFITGVSAVLTVVHHKSLSIP